MTEREFGFTRDRDAARTFEAHLNPLPRSIVRGSQFELLDGDWKFEFDPGDRGLAERWYAGHTYTKTVRWPSAIEEQMAAMQDARRKDTNPADAVVAWYEREFSVPQEWIEEEDAGVQVTFGACGYETRVWLNGHPLVTVEGEDVQFGEFTSFSYELPPELLQPVNRLTVRIADSLDADIPRGKQESRVYKRGGIWYQTVSGAVRSAWIEPIERNRLRSRLGVITTIEDRLVEFVLTTRVQDPGPYRLRLVVTPDGSAEPVATGEFALLLDAGEKRQRIVVEVPNAELWSPARPALYQLAAQLIGPAGSISQIEAHFGLRKIEARGRRVYLNNEPIYLDGILYQPGNASYDQIVKPMRAMKELGCNLVRIHIAGIDPRIYDLADEMGMLLWVEVPSPHSSSQTSRANHLAELRRMLVIVASHPSVVICSLYNEDWGAQDIATSPATREYIARTFDDLRLNYPELLVVDNDGWHHVSIEGSLMSHFLTAHLYTPELDRWRELLDRLVQGSNEGVAVKPLVVGDPFFYQGQVPFLVSEWGGFGFVDYGGPAGAKARAGQIRRFKRELRKRPIAGDIYTQATSIEDEVNGIIDPETGALLVPAGLLGPT